jgi:hypothetical protein
LRAALEGSQGTPWGLEGEFGSFLGCDCGLGLVDRNPDERIGPLNAMSSESPRMGISQICCAQQIKYVVCGVEGSAGELSTWSPCGTGGIMKTTKTTSQLETSLSRCDCNFGRIALCFESRVHCSRAWLQTIEDTDLASSGVWRKQGQGCGREDSARGARRRTTCCLGDRQQLPQPGREGIQPAYLPLV